MASDEDNRSDEDITNTKTAHILPLRSSSSHSDGLMKPTESKAEKSRDSLSIYISQPTQLCNNNPLSWRRNDPIYANLHFRQSLLKKHNPGASVPLAKKTTCKGKLFPIEEALSECQYKLPIIHRAFDAAAFSIIRALQIRQEKLIKATPQSLQVPEKSLNIPKFLDQVEELNQVKREALDIVSNKRKESPSCDSPADGTVSSSNVKNKKRKVETIKTPIKDEDQSQRGDNEKDIDNGKDKKETPMVQLAGYSNFDSRSTMSRAILCAAASLAFEQLTPKSDNVEDISVLDIPQNINQCEGGNGGMGEHPKSELNAADNYERGIDMGAVLSAAEVFAKRTIEQVRGAVVLGEKRRRWRSDCARFDLCAKDQIMGLSKDGVLDQFFRWRKLDVTVVSDSDCADNDGDVNVGIDSHDGTDSDDSFKSSKPQETASDRDAASSEEWNNNCLPRMLEIMNAGTGNAVLHDMRWKTRISRILDILKGLALSQSSGDQNGFDVKFGSGQNSYAIEPNYGPHLIITSEHDLDAFMRALGPLDLSMGAKSKSKGTSFYLRGLRYQGNINYRRKMRTDYFTPICLAGLSSAPYNVIVTTYKTFFEDYIHFCRIPFQTVVLDDGMSWLGTAHYDPNGQIGKVFDIALWNKSDNYAGTAWVEDETWNFALNVCADGRLLTDTNKESNDRSKSISTTVTGLTARRRILVASSLHSRHRDVTYSAPASSILSFLLPQFTEVVREEWDRSRIHTCEKSMEYVQKLICRGIVVYGGFHSNEMNSLSLTMSSMTGAKVFHKNMKDSYHDFPIDRKNCTSTDKMVSDGKIVQSRRFAASWLRIGSPIRQEFGSANLAPIIYAAKDRTTLGGFGICQEVVTSSSITANGAGGAVSGPAAFGLARRCGKECGNEQATRQHLAATHAPPGTWLCRTCSADCGTSQARTHHERSCTLTYSGNSVGTAANSIVLGVPMVGQNAKKQRGTSISTRMPSKVKDDAGNFQVPTYRGVWVTPKGSYFVKINGEVIMEENEASATESSPKYLRFAKSDEAAIFHDQTKKYRNDSSDLNFKPDGSRIIYDELTNSSTGRGLETLGAAASSVVPALSVINIKDLPKGVVPLLRDPKQTSRAGGNAKRFVYAYRGVCRQARKGHDRWQSQISFGGTNHYLGTFDSEWDAAAIYAWAHLILYGEEATNKAKQEGEDAVAAYEQEMKDIAEGKILAPLPVKKKRSAPKSKGTGQRGRRKKTVEQSLTDGQASPLNAEVIKGSIPKMIPELQGRRMPDHDSILISGAIERIIASQSHKIVEGSRCVSIAGLSSSEIPPGHAALIGLSSESCQWSAQDFLDSIAYYSTDLRRDALLTALKNECSLNARFRSMIQVGPCFIGKAQSNLEQASQTLGYYGLEFGGTIGHVDCNVGGIEGSCSEHAICISYSEKFNSYQLKVCGQDDLVTLNGERIIPSMGNLMIDGGDVCSVGARVFIVVLP